MSVDQGQSSQQCTENLIPFGAELPETAWAHRLARGAALKWASGMFCQPRHLEQLGQYKKRESQRTTFIYTRLKAMVQSYIDGVGWGVEKLHGARAALSEGTHLLKKAEQDIRWNTRRGECLVKLQEVSVRHTQLVAAVHNLPHLYSVHSMVLDTERLVESRRLLEAHACLMELERWTDDILWQLQGKVPCAEDQQLVSDYFSGVRTLVDALGRELWAVVSSALTLAVQNPTLFVSAVRIVEREEALDQTLRERARTGARPLPPGRPRCWRANFFEVLKEAVSARFRNVSYLHTRGPGLAGHLSALQHSIMADVATVRHQLEHCVPTHYRLTAAYLRASHQCLQAHLRQVISWDLESGELFSVLYWVLHTYPSAEMMGHPELASLMDQDELGALVSTEALEELQKKYVNSVHTSVCEWMHKALQVELQDWHREQEPDTDHEGFYHTSLPTIIIQMLEENSRVALMIGPRLQERIIQMGLQEMEVLLNRFREALVEAGKKHRTGQTQEKFFLNYLLASISNFIILNDFEQLPDDVPVTATIADVEEKKGFIDYYVFVTEVKTKGGSKYLIYRRYREFLQLHQTLESSTEGAERPTSGPQGLPSLPGKVYIGNKRDIAESRIPELNIYMKKLLALPWLLLDEALRMFFYQSQVDQEQQPRALRRLRPPTRRVKTVKEKMDLLSSPRAEVLFDFRGSGEAELNLTRGQLVYLLRSINKDWLEGTINEQTGIFPQSFVKIIKPLPPSDCDSEGEGGHAYSCLRCFLLRPEDTDTRDVCVQEQLGSQPAYQDLLSRMKTVFQEEDIALNYKDQDGDLVRILDDEDVQLMIGQSRLRPQAHDRPVNQFPWELYVSLGPDLSVYSHMCV
uniref:Neutrophil cytosol factor 4 n=1 Tax=Knipowitschia caucasica TaxID=637954 RepID=A0AAV2MPH9_KNICA